MVTDPGGFMRQIFGFVSFVGWSFCSAFAMAQGHGHGNGKHGLMMTTATLTPITTGTPFAAGNHDQGNNLPPGLAKKDRLPPGLEKQLERRGTLPPGLQRKSVPAPSSWSVGCHRLPPVMPYRD